MNSHVIYLMNEVLKHLLAYVTYEWFLSSVNFAVPNKVTWLCKLFATNTIFVWFLSRMTSSVYSKFCGTIVLPHCRPAPDVRAETSRRSSRSLHRRAVQPFVGSRSLSVRFQAGVYYPSSEETGAWPCWPRLIQTNIELDGSAEVTGASCGPPTVQFTCHLPAYSRYCSLVFGPVIHGTPCIHLMQKTISYVKQITNSDM